MMTLKASELFMTVNEILRTENTSHCRITFKDDIIILELDNGVIRELDPDLNTII